MRSSPVPPDPQPAPPPQGVTTGVNPPAMPRRMQIFNNIYTTQASTGTQLFYGASSNFCLLQQLHTHIPLQTAAGTNREPHGSELEGNSDGIERYNYQSIIFDGVPPPSQYSAQPIFLNPVMARACLRNYLMTLGHLMSFLDADELCSTLEKLYTPKADVGMCERASIIITLALGATSSPDDALGQTLLLQARPTFELTIYETSLRAVQTAFLMSRCEFQTGNAKTSYLHLGIAIRKAFAAGVHRGSSPEAKSTIWAMYCDESIVCFMFGRPHSLSEKDIGAPMPEESTYPSSFVRLCTIIRSTSRLYHAETRSYATDLATANSIYHELCNFSARIQTDLGLELGGQVYALSGEKLFWHITFSHCNIPID